MGEPKFPRRRYQTPSHPWQKDRIDEENVLLKKYGLKNKRELWKAGSLLRSFRQQSRSLLARVRAGDAQAQKETSQLIGKLARLGLLPENATLDDILVMNLESVLSRRYQSQVYFKGLAHTPKQARQLIVHGHASIKGRKMTVPGYLVRKDEEEYIEYNEYSPISHELHPARPKSEEQEADVAPSAASPKKEDDAPVENKEKPGPKAEEKPDAAKKPGPKAEEKPIKDAKAPKEKKDKEAKK